MVSTNFLSLEFLTLRLQNLAIGALLSAFTVPPAIVSIQNFTVFNYSVHRTATLECEVNNRSSTDYVRWIRNDTTLDQSGKYILSTGNVKVHIVATLSVRNLTRSDRGMYLCQAGSKYNTSESAVTVWILEDFTGPGMS